MFVRRNEAQAKVRKLKAGRSLHLPGSMTLGVLSRRRRRSKAKQKTERTELNTNTSMNRKDSRMYKE
jgi:hypothetical protein